MKYIQLILAIIGDFLALIMVISAFTIASPFKNINIAFTSFLFLGTIAITHIVIKELKI